MKQRLIAALLFGVGVCVLGAKLARWFIAVGFAAAGIADPTPYVEK